MSSKVKKELFLEGLDCETYAGIIEERVNALKDVNFATMDFKNKILTIEIEDDDNTDGVLAKAKYIIKDKEPHVVVKTK